MPEECGGESGVVADATESLVDDLLCFSDGVRAEVGEFATFQVAPDLFDRIQVGGVGRKPLDHQPSSLVLDEGLHGSAAVGRESVPDEGDLCLLYTSPSP